jgi:alpha-L-fucosidase
MYNTGSAEYNNQMSKYGDPKGNWPYQNFINGAKDKSGNFVQFAPKLKSAGGNFDPDEWASLFDSAGARFAGPVAEHHDGFSMWASKVNPWNALSKGPKLDLVKVLTDAFRAKGMKIVCSLHTAYNFTGYYQWAPAQSDTNLQKLFGQMPVAKEEQYWLDRLKEVVDGYQPDYIWQDFNLVKISEQMRLNFLAYYYNKESVWGKEVVASYNDGFDNLGEVQQYERGGPGDILYPYWLTEDAISSSTAAMLHSLIDRVSKNGNMLLDIAPMADGAIPQGQRTILLGMGDWLRRFGESIYSTRAWAVYGEGPTKMGGGQNTTPIAGTNKDWRLTRSKDSSTLYAICLGWPGNNTQVTIASITSARFKPTGVAMFGNTAGTFTQINNFTQGAQGLTFTTPSAQPFTALAYAFKISSSRTVGINQTAVAPAHSVSLATGTLCYGALSLNSIKTRQGIAGIEIFTLQGKKILRCMFNNAGSMDAILSLQRNTIDQVSYVKYISDAGKKIP